MDPADPLSVFREATLGGSDGARGRHARAAFATRAGPSALAGFGSAKGINEEAYLFQKLVRTGFGTNNVDHCTRLCHASSVAALLEGIGSGAVSQPGDGRAEGGRRAPDRRQPDRQPSGRGDLDEERGQERHQADPRRSAPLRARAPRRALPAVQARHRRRAAERDDAHDRRGRPRRRVVRRRPHQRLRGAQAQRRRVQPGGDGADLRHSARRRSATVARLFATAKGADDPVGHGHLAARARHRQRALPDRAVHDDRPGRPARHRPASAARPEQRAGRVATPA